MLGEEKPSLKSWGHDVNVSRSQAFTWCSVNILWWGGCSDNCGSFLDKNLIYNLVKANQRLLSSLQERFSLRRVPLAEGRVEAGEVGSGVSILLFHIPFTLFLHLATNIQPELWLEFCHQLHLEALSYSSLLLHHRHHHHQQTFTEHRLLSALQVLSHNTPRLWVDFYFYLIKMPTFREHCSLSVTIVDWSTVAPLTCGFTLHGLSYPQSTTVWKYYMENPRNQQLMSFRLCVLLKCVLLNRVMKSCAVSPHPAWMWTISLSSVPTLCMWLTFGLNKSGPSQKNCCYLSACVQVTCVLLNATFT